MVKDKSVFYSKKSHSSPSSRKKYDINSPLSKVVGASKKRKNDGESKKKRCIFSKKMKIVSIPQISTKSSSKVCVEF